MIRNTMLAMTTFVLIACAQSASVEASDHINLLPHPYFPPALSAKLQTASANPLEGKLLRYLIGTDGPVSGSHDTVIEVAYDVGRPPAKGMAILQSVRRGEHRQIRSLSAHVGHRRAI